MLEEASRLLYTVAEGDRGEALVYSPAADDLLTPEELSGWVLRHLAQRAERHTRAAVTGAVIAVPAHFGRQQKAATLEAAAQAGLRQVHLLQGERGAEGFFGGLGGGGGRGPAAPRVACASALWRQATPRTRHPLLPSAASFPCHDRPSDPRCIVCTV